MSSPLHLIAAMSVGLVGLSHGATAIYEPFNYSVGSLGGQGGSELGLTGTWTVNTTNVGSGSYSWGSLATAGNSVGPTSASQNRFMASRSIDASALSGSGLLNDGAELWFSVIMGYGAGGNRTNTRLGFALGDDRFTGGNFDYDLDSGNGLGVTMGRFSGTNGKLIATHFTAPNDGGSSGFSNNVFDTNAGSISATFPGANTTTDVQLVVGRITWGASSDTIDLFLPGTDLALPGAVHSTLTVNVDQSGFDTITMQRGDIVVVDEIRFGASYLDVTPVPEPSALLLGSLGGLLLLRRRV